MTNWVDVVEAFKSVLEPLEGVHLYDYVPESPNVPCIIIYPERIPYSITEPVTFVLWCLAGIGETQGSQHRMLEWLQDDGDNSIVGLLDESHDLHGVVSSVLPLEVRTLGIAPTQEGRARYLQAELVCEVLRKTP